MTHLIFDERGAVVDSLAPEQSLRDLVTKLDGPASAVSFAGLRYV
jgi:hypothetical protein